MVRPVSKIANLKLGQEFLHCSMAAALTAVQTYSGKWTQIRNQGDKRKQIVLREVSLKPFLIKQLKQQILQ